MNRERNLYGSEFEIKLRNELSQKAIAKECAEWIRRKACFKSNYTGENMMGFATVDDKAYMPVTGFTTVELGCERGDNAYTVINKFEAPFSQQYLFLFDQLWNDSAKMQVVTDKILDNISNVYKENAPDFIYFVTLYNIFREFLDDLSEDDLPNEATGFKESQIWNKLYNSRRMPALPSSTSWRSTTAASLPTAWDWARRLPPSRSSSITRTATSQCLCFARRNLTTTG